MGDQLRDAFGRKGGSAEQGMESLSIVWVNNCVEPPSSLPDFTLAAEKVDPAGKKPG